jgi:hypothetical protein
MGQGKRRGHCAAEARLHRCSCRVGPFSFFPADCPGPAIHPCPLSLSWTRSLPSFQTSPRGLFSAWVLSIASPPPRGAATSNNHPGCVGSGTSCSSPPQQPIQATPVSTLSATAIALSLSLSMTLVTLVGCVSDALGSRPCRWSEEFDITGDRCILHVLHTLYHICSVLKRSSCATAVATSF